MDAPAEVGTVVDAGSGSLEAAPPGDTGAPADAPPSSDDGGGCPAAWTPTALSGLVLWLDANQGIGVSPGSPVAVWHDQSSAHNDAAQSTASYQPTFEDSDIGGLPGLRFNGQLNFLAIPDSSSLQWGTKDYTVAIVARFSISAGTVNQMLYQKSVYNAPYDGPTIYVRSARPVTLGTGVTNQISENVLVTSAAQGLNDAPHLFTGRRFGSAIEIRVDGVVQGSTMPVPSVDVSAPGQSAIIGANGYTIQPGFQALQGDVSEIVAVEGPISDADLQTLECHLIAKYGL